eukprot:TRINITY_DN52081_c0_g1_i1.p1 TRINITY_DN52081_c0_g1~~TRINITY_DN52081_c0_g1_i1.p1  ORF type:complete len:407 (+),score=78.09 TRINITY_DN52081_c0_g1_i1:46-1221(+)
MGNSASQKIQEAHGGVCCAPDKRTEEPFEVVARGQKIKVALAATPLFTVLGFTAYHTSVLVGERELFFDGSGINEANAFKSHHSCQELRSKAVSDSAPPSELETEVTELGFTQLDCFDLKDILSVFFKRGSYDVLRKNCNSFSDAAIYVLTQQRLDAKYSRLERWVVALEPMSTDVIKNLVKPLQDDTAADAAEATEPGYVINPRAVGFDIEGIIAELHCRLEGDSPQPALCIALKSTYCCGKPLPSQNAEEDILASPRTLLEVEASPKKIWDPFSRSNRGRNKVFPAKRIWTPDGATDEAYSFHCPDIQDSSHWASKMNNCAQIKPLELTERLMVPPPIPPRSSSRAHEEDRVCEAEDDVSSPLWSTSVWTDAPAGNPCSATAAKDTIPL